MPTSASRSIIIFGASGSIGAALCKWHLLRDVPVVAVSRSGLCPDEDLKGCDWRAWGLGEGSKSNTLVDLLPQSCAGVIWAQGMNCTDNIKSFDLSQHRDMYTANVETILQSLTELLSQDVLIQGSSLCIISSIWQNIARQEKLSYCVTKAALSGLVQSLSIDLGKDDMKVNAVLPGAVDTPMTRANLSSEQIENLNSLTPLKSLATLDDVCSIAGFLCSEQNTGITGQFIAADRGFSHAKIL
jgi:3-oxoacyl-[acyl-carrier protein] reductase